MEKSIIGKVHMHTLRIPHTGYDVYHDIRPTISVKQRDNDGFIQAYTVLPLPEVLYALFEWSRAKGHAKLATALDLLEDKYSANQIVGVDADYYNDGRINTDVKVFTNCGLYALLQGREPEPEPEPDNTTPRLYVWNDVLTDYTSGMACAIATSEDEARQALLSASEGNDQLAEDIACPPSEVLESPSGVYVWGGA